MAHDDLKEKHNFEILFKENYSTLCKIANGYFRDKNIVEDIVCDTFVKLWDNRHTIEIKASARDYLIRSLINKCIDIYRREKEHKNRDISIDDEQNIICHTLADLNQNPLDYLLSQEQQKQLEQAIEQLPARYRETFELICIEGISYNETAAIMHISKNTVKSNLREAIRILRNNLKNLFIIILLIISEI
jgi:RNA polymerase sigma-70 factor (ECF subfamily)